MVKFFLHLVFGLTAFVSCDGFYKPFDQEGIKTYIPQNIDQLKRFLCGQYVGGYCIDTEPAKIIINKMFDFRGSEGNKTEKGCFQRTKPEICLKNGQLRLNISNQCDGLKETDVSYDVAGKIGIEVGSNKIVIGQDGGGLEGKGLRLRSSKNVEIRNLIIRNINPQVIWGGDAIELSAVENILIDGNYIKDIGRMMIVSHFGNSTGVMISNNVFDGRTEFSAFCNGYHYWLWLFVGTEERIVLQNNVVFHTDGRGPHLIAAQNSKTLLHMIQNIFYDIKDNGLIQQDDSQSSVLVEGNIFYKVSHIVLTLKGHIFMPQNEADAAECLQYFGRNCLLNTVVKSGDASPDNSIIVLEDFNEQQNYLAEPISMRCSITELINLPPEVEKLIK